MKLDYRVWVKQFSNCDHFAVVMSKKLVLRKCTLSGVYSTPFLLHSLQEAKKGPYDASTCEHVSLQDRKDSALVIKQRILNWGDCPGLSWWAQCNHRGLPSGRMREESQNRRRSEDEVKFRMTQLLVLELQGKHKLRNTEASRNQNCSHQSKPRKLSDRFSLDLSEGPPGTLISAPEDLFWTSEFQSYKRINPCCFKLLTVW